MNLCKTNVLYYQTCVKKIHAENNPALYFFISKAILLKDVYQLQNQYFTEFFRPLKNQHTLIARCVFVYTAFQVASPKTILPFLQKGEKNGGTCFLFFLKF